MIYNSFKSAYLNAKHEDIFLFIIFQGLNFISVMQKDII